MGGVANFCDYFVICSGSISRHVKAIADGVEDGLADLGIKVKMKQGEDSISRSKGFVLGGQAFPSPSGDAGMASGAWMLLDMGDVVVHIFEGESREFYALDHLWCEAKQVEWNNK